MVQALWQTLLTLVLAVAPASAAHVLGKDLRWNGPGDFAWTTPPDAAAQRCEAVGKVAGQDRRDTIEEMRVSRAAIADPRNQAMALRNSRAAYVRDNGASSPNAWGLADAASSIDSAIGNLEYQASVEERHHADLQARSAAKSDSTAQPCGK